MQDRSETKHREKRYREKEGERERKGERERGESEKRERGRGERREERGERERHTYLTTYLQYIHYLNTHNNLPTYHLNAYIRTYIYTYYILTYTPY